MSHLKQGVAQMQSLEGVTEARNRGIAKPLDLVSRARVVHKILGKRSYPQRGAGEIALTAGAADFPYRRCGIPAEPVFFLLL